MIIQRSRFAFIVAVLAGCGTPAHIGQQQSPVFVNGGFESGTAGSAPSSWTVTTYSNATGVTIQSPQTRAGLNLAANSGNMCSSANQCTSNSNGYACTGGECVGSALTTTLAATGMADPDLTSTASLRYCRYGSQCAIVNSDGKNENVNSLAQTMTVGSGDVDSVDGLIHVRLVVAPVLQNPTSGHTSQQQPYFFVQVTNVTRSNAVLYSNFNYSGQVGVPWKQNSDNSIRYTDWQLIDVVESNGSIKQGDQITLEIIASGCQPGGHWGKVYVDGIDGGGGGTVPGLFISGSAPAQTTSGSNLTYTLTYKNGSTMDETGVTASFTIPTGTTFVSSATTTPGLTCVGPTAGVVTCTQSGTLTAGSSGSFTVTVNVTAANGTEITEGTYSIQSTQEGLLLGNVINTYVGCTADAQCASGNWCNETSALCTATLANGVAVPTDTPHSNPTLNGTCTIAAGALVCTSAACDTKDNKCGYANNDGTCDSTTGAVVCRSGACDPDGKCGYVAGDGPCTPGNGTVCRSGACSHNGFCELSGGCNVDADCASGTWCKESTNTCTATLANGTALPTDGPHANPTLDGACTTDAATLVCTGGTCETSDNLCGLRNSDGPCTANAGCRSGVCDGDGKCGYANGDGPCTLLTGATLCRSGICSLSGKCLAVVGGCNVDTDCLFGTWCDESTSTCTAKLANGSPLPSDPPHANPTLDGTCTTDAAMLVCTSGVCDTDKDCGYANGDGSCTPGLLGNGGVVCRSGACDPDGHCGFAVGDGPCTTGTASVCRSDTCSSNGKCTLMNGCNVDADCTGGDWCDESTHACTAKLANGTPVPSDPPHANPALDGTCTTDAATLVCASGVCDTDNACGYANGDGSCTPGPNAAVCRSGMCSLDGHCVASMGCHVDGDCASGSWCDESTSACMATLPNGTALPVDAPHTSPTLDGTCTNDAAMLVCTSGVCDTADSKCGYADGDGMCSTGNAALVCRSMMCSADGRCLGASSCHVDADCTTGTWCDETTQLCTPTLMNGMPIPTDPPHTTPTLDGTCTVPAGTLVCTSGVCDTADGECGYANGDGTCNSTTAATVCRSGACSSDGHCVAVMGCHVDGDCTGGDWCDEATSTCTGKLANGKPVPNDPLHSNPALDGTCTTAAATLVCASGVCDTKDNDCGYGDGDGPCMAATGSTVCRSGVCSSDGACRPTNGCETNADCTEPAKPSCDPATHVCVAGASPDMAATASGPSLNGGGGAGCSAAGRSGGDGVLVVAMLLAFALLRERKRRVAFFTVALALSLSSVARAQTQAPGAAIDVYRPSAAGSDWFSLDSLDYRGRVRVALSATLDYAHAPLSVYAPGGARLTDPIRHQGWVDLGASIMLFERLRLQAMLPVAFYQSGSPSVVDGEQVHPNHKGGLGDLRLGADVRLWGRYGHPFSVSIGGNVTFPTGDRKADFGNGNVTGDAHAAIAGDLSLFTYAAQVGFAFRRDQQVGDVRFNDEVQFAAAIGVRLAKKRLLIGPRYGMGDVGSSAGHARKGDLEGDLGVHYKLDCGLRFGAGVGTGLVRSPGVPDVRVLANVGWMMPYHEKKPPPPPPSDIDGDGIIDVEDACLEVKGVRSSIAARNGCPSDRDADGILDTEDQCPDVAQGDHPDPKRIGCPDKDTDGDGVYDSNDQCVDVAQGDHPDPKRIGCPDKDTDGDGVYDSADLCPSEPAGLAPDPSRLGCPLPDRDGDRVADDVDACPDKPGAPSHDPKKNGCPGLVRVTDSKIAILRPVLFATGKDIILATSYPVLEAVAETLRDVPEIKHISIQGHTDSQGKPAANLDLSDRRARSVMRWLVAHGIDEARLDAKGFGQTQPIAPNKTAAGRATNRRVDFVIAPVVPPEAQ